MMQRFKESPDGANPSGGLILDAEGNLYGVTSAGGANGAGTLFKVDPSGAETVLSSMNGTGGGEPNGDLAMNANGNFYGTASAGGKSGKGLCSKSLLIINLVGRDAARVVSGRFSF